MVLIHRVNESDSECPFFKCLKLCVSNPLVDVDETDGRECRALDYAAKYKQKRVQKLLLERGAYLGGRDTFGKYTLCKVDPIVLKQHLDSCIYTTSEGYKGREANEANIFVMLNNFIPPTYKTNQWRRKPVSSNVSCKSILPALIEFSNSSEQLYDINMDHRLHFLEHPVISTLLYIREPPSHCRKMVLRVMRVLPLKMLVLKCLLCNKMQLFPTLCIQIMLFVYEVITNFAYLKNSFHRLKDGLFLMDESNICTLLVELVLFSYIFVRFMVSKNPLSDTLVLVCIIVLAGIAMKRFIASFNQYADHIYKLDVVLAKTVNSFLLYSFIPITYALCYYTIVSRQELATNNDGYLFNSFHIHSGKLFLFVSSVESLRFTLNIRWIVNFSPSGTAGVYTIHPGIYLA
uniref:Ion transport domain-containing protein n=1 Tax=Anopheles maculatus TaxID=74869 RepID=A0A182SY52_9DIPT